MIVRPATAEDMGAVVGMGEAFHRAAGLLDFAEWDSESFATMVEALLRGAVNGALLVVENDGQVVGMASCLIYPAYFNFGTQIGQELFWFVEPEHRFGAGTALIAELERVAKARGASVFMSASVAGLRDAALARFYLRRGYRPVENTYIKGLT